MVVNFEFLDDEPIENVVTCMNYKVDKVVYFGYHDIIEKQKEQTETFLTGDCGVAEVVFHALSSRKLQAVLKDMRKEIQHELSLGGELYFDITGGESLILVAFGMLSNEFETPIHYFDIPTGELIELDEGSRRNLSECVEQQDVQLKLSRLIEMKGGIINEYRSKPVKQLETTEFKKDVEGIWRVAQKYSTSWSAFASVAKKDFRPGEDLKIRVSEGKLSTALSKTRLKSLRKFEQILYALGAEGLLRNVAHSNNQYSFQYKSEAVKECILEEGSVLELHMYHQELENSDDCMIGVHLDWDGEIHFEYGVDVINEVDVLSIRGYVPTFMSCKIGKMTNQSTLHALYELDTIANRFGGKYARRVLVTMERILPIYEERAREMGIEVVTLA